MAPQGKYGEDEYGTSPYGSAYSAYGLESALSLSPTTVRVRFTAMADFGYAPNLNPFNYQISPALNVLGVVVESAQSVVLLTEPQDQVLYTIVAEDARGFNGEPLDPALNTVTFSGDQRSSFIAVATGPRRVRAVFFTEMLDNAALVDPASYTITDLNLVNIPILTVEKEQASNPRSVVLTVDQDLVDEAHYQLILSPSVVTSGSEVLVPLVQMFQWVRNELRVSVPLELFTGEVTDPQFGVHNGLVFFSPSLLTAAPNSTIQIDEVSTCTKAFDEYHFPEPIDPVPLYTHGAGVVPTPKVTTLNQEVLWAPFPRLFEATLTLSDLHEDTVPLMSDGVVTATFTQPWDLTYVSLLNNTEWKTFDNAGTPPEYFKTADNLSPIPPGATTIVVLHRLLEGDSALTATMEVT